LINEQGYLLYDRNRTQSNLSKLFIKHFGLNSCISTDKTNDDMAKYYGYNVIKFPTSLQRLYEILNIHLSNQVKGVSKIKYNIIDKPNEINYQAYVNSPYIKLVKSCLILEEILKDVFMITKYKKDYLHYNYQIYDLLPNEKCLNET